MIFSIYFIFGRASKSNRTNKQTEWIGMEIGSEISCWTKFCRPRIKYFFSVFFLLFALQLNGRIKWPALDKHLKCRKKIIIHIRKWYKHIFYYVSVVCCFVSNDRLDTHFAHSHHSLLIVVAIVYRIYIYIYWTIHIRSLSNRNRNKTENKYDQIVYVHRSFEYGRVTNINESNASLLCLVFQ